MTEKKRMNDETSETIATQKEDLPVLSLASTTGKTDEDVFDEVLGYLSSQRLEIKVGYLEEDGVLTHQSIMLKVGDIEGASSPQRMLRPLRIVEQD